MRARQGIDLVLPRQRRRDILRRALETAVTLRREGRLGDKELTAINMGTAQALDDEGVGPTADQIREVVDRARTD